MPRKHLSSLRKDRSGESMFAMILTFIVLLIAVPMTLIIGVAINHSTSTGISQLGYTTAENTTVTNIQSGTSTAFGLMANAPLLLGAGAIISIIVGAFAFALTKSGGGL
jgi:hypothetical protein